MDLSNNFRGEYTVTFKGKETKALFTMNAIRLILNGEKIQLPDFEKWVGEDPLTAIPSIAYYSVMNWHVRNGKKFGAAKEQFIAEMLDEDGNLETISDAISVAMSTGEEGK